jgi:hypothetical protein
VNRNASTPLSLAASGAGAILAFAITVPIYGLNVNVIGWILMELGLAGLLVSIMLGTANADCGGVTYEVTHSDPRGTPIAESTDDSQAEIRQSATL